MWFEKNKNSLNLKFKSYNTSCMGQTRKDFIQDSKIHSELLFRHYSYYSDTRGVTALPPNRNLISRFGRSSSSNRHSEQLLHSSQWQDEVWMAIMEEVFAFPCCFFFRVVAPCYLEEFDCVYASWHDPSDPRPWSGARGSTSQPRAVSLQATQRPSHSDT
jgi:hypothetical protein